MHEAASNSSSHGHYKPRTWLPSQETWKIRQDAAYLHICGNETIDGIEFFEWPGLPEQIPLVVDASSHILSRPLDVSRFGLIFCRRSEKYWACRSDYSHSARRFNRSCFAGVS